MAKINANSMIASIEVVRNSYMGKIGGSSAAAEILSFFRNAAIDVI
jgi:hypothetical protein